MGGKAGRKRAAGNREEEEAVQGRKAEATGPGGWAENKLSFWREAFMRTGKAAIGYSFSLSGTQFPAQQEEPERPGLTCCPSGSSGTSSAALALPSFSLM